MKKNLIFGISLVLVVLMASGVFAGLFGLTGNALRTGERIAQDSSLTIKGIEDNKVRIGNEIYSQGETFSDSGKIYEVRAIEKKAWFLGSDKVVVEEVEPIEPKIPVELCTDSDGGLDYYVKGTRTSQEGTYSDTCRPSTAISDTSNYSSGKYLLELYCGKKKYTDGVKLEVASEFYECPNGCKEGACVGEEPTSEVTYEGVLKMLNTKCSMTGGFITSERSCDDLCFYPSVEGYFKRTCIFAQVQEDFSNELKALQVVECNELIDPAEGSNLLVSCMCC
ncbi:MAG: hypothetical protein KJ949_02820 [Nanoarchaeota archaeon]|nr:hypothetical protein [Nanoarchaeota archaeon]